MSNATIWQAILGDLEVTNSKATFETWLRNTKLLALEDNVAVISVPNIFYRSWLETHCKEQVIQSFEKYGTPITGVRFEIEGSTPTTPEDEEEIPVVEMVTKPTPKSTPQPTGRTTGIIAHHTFSSLVEGNHNRLAYTVSTAVAKTPGTLYNPLFIYGGVGLGKTHLMHAIANEVMANDPTKQVLYVSCEKFTNDYILAISNRKTDQFKQTYRTLDLLLVDDIQFLSNKEGSQEEFFNTFNTLHQSNRQIVLAADRIPSAIPGLEERLTSRFGWGMIVDIQAPNLETRTAILQRKCQQKNVTFPREALAYIASQVQTNIRDLEGALNRAITYCQMSHIPFSLEATKAALSGLIVNPNPRPQSPDTVLRLIAEHFGLNMDDLIGKKRTKELVYPRQITMYIMREELHLSFPVIARELGGKDHTTVMYGYNKIVKELPNSNHCERDIAAIKDRIRNI